MAIKNYFADCRFFMYPLAIERTKTGLARYPAKSNIPNIEPD